MRAQDQGDGGVAYHEKLATSWEDRYEKSSFRARLRVFEECLTRPDVRERDWLDAGCGSGTLARWLADAGARVIGVDAAEEMLAQACELSRQARDSQSVRYERVETIARLPLADGSVDGVLCSSVLEYVSDPIACVSEFARVLRPGGVLVVSVPNRNSLVRIMQIRTHRLGRQMRQRWWSFLDYSHNQYSARTFGMVLSDGGFTVERVIPFGSPIPEWLQRLEFGGSLLAFRAVRR